MKTKAVFYHAGCPVCLAAENNLATALDATRYDVEIVHIGQDKARVAGAERAGVKSVPALVLGGAAYHINFGAGIEALR
ncbi:MAG: thioredoxin family protein [Opitutae bacterium]|nr:thioredoxin family protein [Opitutae bacterium]